MSDNSERINSLLEKLDALTRKQEQFQREITELKREINILVSEEKEIKGKAVISREKSAPVPVPDQAWTVSDVKEKKQGIKLPNIRSDFEKFIGENLINKIGIAILIIGVGIGAKYAIDHQWISPLTRIILGYLAGIALLGVALRLKNKYEDFSAVLLSGAMAILYFITYFAYSLYTLIPQVPAFGIMVMFTIFTVLAAIRYNRQVIAHIGLVGAYAVPFLLSSGAGKAGILFSYMTIINGGILILAIRKYWKPLYYVSMGLTWLIFLVWFRGTGYDPSVHFSMSLIFLSIFFIMFYLTFLGYKLVQNEKFSADDVILLMVNSFIYFGIGYAILKDHEPGKHLLGLFTLVNAGLHFIIGIIIQRRKPQDRNLFYLVQGLVLIFITIAVPVQLKANWITLLWTGEAVLLYWIGVKRGTVFYERISYPLMLLAFLSLCIDWSDRPEYLKGDELSVLPVFNVYFLGSLLFTAAFGYIIFLHYKRPDRSKLYPDKSLSELVNFMLPAFLLIALYNTFRIEFSEIFRWMFDQFNRYELTWNSGYTMLFISTLIYFNQKIHKNRLLGYILLGISMVTLLMFLAGGLFQLGVLREKYILGDADVYAPKGIYYFGARYLSFASAGILLYFLHGFINQDFITRKLKIIFDLFMYFVVLYLVSNELISWMDLAGSSQSYKLGLSILWGAYSLLLIAWGIMKKKKHLRLGAIVLFGITLLKLFFYDLVRYDTISKTILFILLGTFLLIISFLYNKYKHLI